jgi:hypothetical protein
MLRISLPALLAGVTMVGVASAQTITWGPVQPSVSPTDVSTNGLLVFAGNAHNPNVAAINATVNGVTFAGGFHPLDWNGYIVGGLNGSTTGDAEFDKLLGSSLAMQNASAPPDANPTQWGGIRLDNLVAMNPGYAYEVQVWFTDQRTGSPTNVLYDRVMTLSSAFGTATVTGGVVTNLGSMVQGPLSGPMDADPDNAPAASSPDTSFGTHCTGTFVYNPAAELWLIVRGSHPIPSNVLQPHITGLQIRDLSSASHQSYGTGCYSYTGPDLNSNLMEAFASSAAAKTALDGNAMLFSLAGDGYVATWLPGAASAVYVAPTASATVVADGDDTVTTFSPSVATPVPGGTASQWTVMSNGVLTASATGNQGTDWTSTLAETAGATGLAWYTWRDYNPTLSGSGKIKTEEVGGVLYVTFDGVYEHTTTSPATFQFQVYLGTGDVLMAWPSMAPSANTATVIAGATLAGAGPTPTSVPLSTANPILMLPPPSLQPLTLSASPAPVINPSTVVTYTLTNVPEFMPGFHVGTIIFSLNPMPAGIDLSGILTTVPGCKVYIATLDADIGGMSGPTSTLSFTLNYSNVYFAPGNVVAAQAVSLFDPNIPLLNGEAGGYLVSNAVKSTTQLQ